MKIYEINQEKQSNGIWGTPLNCYYIDKFLLLDDRKLKLQSAAIALFNQIWNTPFKIINATPNGFIFESENTKSKLLSFRYDRYELVDNKLYEFETDKEHKIFLRKQKLKNLENELYNSLEEYS